MDTVQKTLTSNDGTMIAYEQSGTGPVVILVASSLADRAILAEFFEAEDKADDETSSPPGREESAT